jgi:hypothetical protein
LILKKKFNIMNGLLITGLLAILGTVVGGIIKSRQEIRSANKKFQSDLILRALESDGHQEKMDSLQFLLDIRLISDSELKEGIKNIKGINVAQERKGKIPQKGIIKGHQEIRSANKKFQSDLILRALESDDPKERIDSLQFLLDIRLISDSELKEGITQVIKEGAEDEKNIPHFTQVSSVCPPVNTVVPTDGNEAVFALVALKVRSGSIIDSITPVFAEVTSDLKFQNRRYGLQIGGKGGTEKLLEKEGYIVTGIDVVRGRYIDFDQDEIVHIQVFWHKLTPQGIDPTTKIASEKLGSGYNAKSLKPPEKLLVDSGYYISDLTPSYSHRTSGKNYINNIVIKQSKLPTKL